MTTRSIWTEDSPAIEAPPLDVDATCDVLVVGGGIAGLSAAYEAAHLGRSVIVIDRGDVGAGMTAHTTAHLASESDDWNFKLIDAHGKDAARTNYESQVAAINRIEAICRDEGIDCDFVRLDGFLVPAEPADMDDLKKEYEACREIGMAVEWSHEAPVPLAPGTRALRFPDQGRFHPLKYCAGLARAIVARGGRLHGQTAYSGQDEEEEIVTVETGTGHKIRAGAVMYATNSPVNERVSIHTKQVPMRTYAIAGKVEHGAVADALLWDTREAYHYVRIQPAGADGDWLIVGGEDHRSGTADDGSDRFDRLEKWARKNYPALGEVSHRWSGQVMEPSDFLPYSGRTPHSKRTFLHTGDSGMGMTNAVAGALNFAALLDGGKAHFAELFDPARKPLSRAGLGEYVKGQGAVLANLAEYVTQGEIDSADELKPGEGAVVRRGKSKIAAWRAPGGKLVERSAVCPHAGCIVHWNGTEHCWDCPCHGSQFKPDGSVINGPAIGPLAEVDKD